MAKKKKVSINPEGPRATLKIPKKKMVDLKGFEDVIDVFLEEQEVIESDKSKISFEKSHDNYSLYDFLDLERKRLCEVENFFSIKIPNMNIHNQTKLLIKNQVEKKTFMKDDIVRRIKAEDSSFINQMRQIFDQAFK